MDHDDGNAASMDDDPLTYFLTPAPLLDDNDDYEDPDVMDFGFDAGIEDAKHPPEIVRSVSPSSLDGLSLPPPRPPTPPRSPPVHLSPDPESATDEEDDGEDYIRFGIGRQHILGLPFNLKDFTSLAGKRRTTAGAKGKSPAGGLMSPSSSPPTSHSPAASPRGRSTGGLGSSPPGSRYGSGRGRTSRQSSRRRSPHAWREPSPDVWSIEEDPEEEAASEMASSVGPEDLAARMKEDIESARLGDALDAPAAKPKKRVRFVLPVKED
jgi:hypothetical protein